MLTPKQEKFVHEIVSGKSQADAYRSAYNAKKMSDKTIVEAASRLMADSNVSARVSELRKELTKATIMSAQKRLEWLSERITDDDVDINAKLKAIDIMNKMQGEYIQRIEADVNNDVYISVELTDE